MKQAQHLRRHLATLLLLAVTTLTWAYNFEKDGIYYDTNTDGTSVTVTYKTSSDRGYSGSVVIPSTVTYGGTIYNVTSIGEKAFLGCTGLESITIPESVTSISSSAFSGCSDLTSVTLNSNSIVSKTYASGSNLKTFFGSQVKEYVLGDNITSIGDYAFYGCSGLTSITIPNSVTSIGYSAFFNCTGLTKAEFASIESLCKINFSGGSDSNPLYYAKHLYVNGQEVTDVVIPSNITRIGRNAFSGCSGLTSITIPNSVTNIGVSAFSGCTGLTSVNIPNSVTSIDSSAFSGCTGLTSVTIGKNVTYISDYAFRSCSNLTSVTLNSNSIVSRTYTTNSNIGNIFGSQVKDFILGHNITSIGDYAFNKCTELTSVLIPYSVTKIGNRAFENCSSLTSMAIPESVTNIGDYTFSKCTALTSVTIPNSVTSIGNYAFYKCSGVTSVTIANGLTSISNYVFGDCSALTSVTIPNSITNIGLSAFRNCVGLTSVTIPNSVTNIGNYAFYRCSGITAVSIGDGITSIGDGAFSGCTELTSVTCNAHDLPSTGASAFNNVPQSTATLYVPAESVNAYKSAYPWSEFGTILAITPTGVESLTTDENSGKDRTDAAIYDLQGRRLNEKPTRGYYIQGGKKYIMK